MAKRRKTLSGVNFDLREIEPLTRNQLTAFESSKNLVLHGLAGTGKTFISSYLAFDDMTKGEYQKLVIIRSAVPTRDIGFLPGTEKEKASVYEEPYKDIANDLFGRGDAYDGAHTRLPNTSECRLARATWAPRAWTRIAKALVERHQTYHIMVRPAK